MRKYSPFLYSFLSAAALTVVASASAAVRTIPGSGCESTAYGSTFVCPLLSDATFSGAAISLAYVDFVVKEGKHLGGGGAGSKAPSAEVKVALCRKPFGFDNNTVLMQCGGQVSSAGPFNAGVSHGVLVEPAVKPVDGPSSDYYFMTVKTDGVIDVIGVAWVMP